MNTSVKDIFIAASRAWEKGQSKKAFTLFLEAAKKGDSGAQLNLAHFYETGEAVRKDAVKALHWYKRAWRRGRLTSACSNIADLYAKAGNGRRARFWWRTAVANGDGDAALDFAKFLLKDDGSRAHAVRLLKLAMRSKRISPAGAREAKALIRRISS